MQTVIYIVRHGQTAANVSDTVQGQTDVPLDEIGLQQALAVGKRLQKQHFDIIYSSDLSRAKVTAEAIAGCREIHYTPELREWQLGEWQGLTLQEIRKKYISDYSKYCCDSPDFAPPGAESSREFFDRAANFMNGLVQKHPGQTILCVSHGGFLRMVLKMVLQLPVFSSRPATGNTGISCFRWSDNKKWQLITWNDCAHLTDAIESSGW